MDYKTYYAGPVYESKKSTYTVRYFNDFDLVLMKSFDANPEIADYFQPQASIVVNMPGEDEQLVKLDFWLKFVDGLDVWVHIAEPGSSSDDPIFALARAGCPGKCVFSIIHPPSIELQEVPGER